MKSIKGPKSALSDFISEHGISINSLPSKKKEDISGSEKREFQKKKTKRLKYHQPVELANTSCNASTEDICISKILENLEDNKYTDELIDSISMYLSRKRKMNLFYFIFLCSKCDSVLKIYDCSMIEDDEYLIVPKSLKILELYQCGQLRNSTLNKMLGKMSSLECLRITGAYLIEEFEIPKGLKVLDLTHCSRISSNMINIINQTFYSLEELRLSFCYKLTDGICLKTAVERLYICETNLSEKFFMEMKDSNKLKALSVSHCPKINNLPFFESIEYLDISGIVTLKELYIPDSIRILNASHCYQIKNFNYPALEKLNVSHIDLKEDLISLCRIKSLRELDVSWNNNVNDNFIDLILTEKFISKLMVWGCFSLTKKTAEKAWLIKDSIKIFGCPSETIFLLDN